MTGNNMMDYDKMIIQLNLKLTLLATFKLYVHVFNIHPTFLLFFACKKGDGEHKATTCFVPELGEGLTQPMKRTRF